MGRQNRRKSEEPRGGDPARAAGNEVVESGPDGDWRVRSIRGSSSTKVYRCPGCDQEIRPATPHIVAWPDGDQDATHRRHWHKACWTKRHTRKPKFGV